MTDMKRIIYTPIEIYHVLVSLACTYTQISGKWSALQISLIYFNFSPKENKREKCMNYCQVIFEFPLIYDWFPDIVRALTS